MIDTQKNCLIRVNHFDLRYFLMPNFVGGFQVNYTQTAKVRRPFISRQICRNILVDEVEFTT
jgi:hypothetical protein